MNFKQHGSYHLPFIAFLFYSQLLHPIFSHPANTHISCGLVSNLSPNKAKLTERSAIMSITNIQNPPQTPFATLHESVEEPNWFEVRLNEEISLAWAFVVHTDFGELKSEEGSGTIASSDSCEPNQDIHYGLLPGQVVLYKPKDKLDLDSEIVVLGSTGFGNSFGIQKLTLREAVKAPASNDDDNNEIDGHQVAFGVVVAILTVLYAWFVVDTLELMPERFRKKKH